MIRPALIACVVVIGLAPMRARASEEEAKQALFAGEDALAAGRAADAVTAFDRAIAALGRARLRVQQPLVQALVAQGNFRRAKLEVERLAQLGGTDVSSLRARIDGELARDERAWSDAVRSQDPQSLERYRQTFPFGGHLAEVQQQIAVAREARAFSSAYHNPAALEEFLRQYPASRRAPEARTRIAELRRQAAANAAYADEQAFRRAQQSGSVYEYREYLYRHPYGRFRAEAQAAIALRLQSERRGSCAVEVATYKASRNKFALRLGLSLGGGLGLIGGGIAILATKPTSQPGKTSGTDLGLGLGLMGVGGIVIGVGVPKSRLPEDPRATNRCRDLGL